VDTNECTSFQVNIRYETAIVVTTHELLLSLLIWFLAFLVPSLTAFKGWGMKPPVAFELVFSAGILLRRVLVLTILASLVLLWMDALAYRAIRCHRGPGAASIWFISVVIVLLSIFVFCLIAITAPLRQF
jgi:hypothetical protein